MKKIRFPLIMTVLALLTGICACILLLVLSPWSSPLPAAFLYFVPAVFFGIITGICVSGKVSEKICGVMTAVLIPIFLIGGFFLTLWLGFETATQSVTDVEYYEDVLDVSSYDSWHDDTDIDLFPDDIPKNAENITFYYTPQFLQGGETLALSYKSSAEQIGEYLEDLTSDSIWRGKLGDASDYPIDKDPFVRSNIEWSESTEVLVFTAQPYIAESWNHGTLVYAFVDNDNHTVMFVYERW